MKSLIVDNIDIINIIDADKDIQDNFIDIISILSMLSYNIALNHDENLIELYQSLYDRRSSYNDNKKLINKLLEKYSEHFSEVEFKTKKESVKNLSKEETCEFKEVIKENFVLNYTVEDLVFNSSGLQGMRNIINVDNLKQILLALSLREEKIDEFMKRIRIIMNLLLFDKDIEYHLRLLSDGFDNRKHEIIYHLYCIEKEITEITRDNNLSYCDIGNAMSIQCSPERKRYDELKVVIDGQTINCELHTKFKRISSKAPDRIYFCPKLPSEVWSDKTARIFIYRITKHI